MMNFVTILFAIDRMNQKRGITDNSSRIHSRNETHCFDSMENWDSYSSISVSYAKSCNETKAKQSKSKPIIWADRKGNRMMALFSPTPSQVSFPLLVKNRSLWLWLRAQHWTSPFYKFLSYLFYPFACWTDFPIVAVHFHGFLPSPILRLKNILCIKQSIKNEICHSNLNFPSDFQEI